MVASWFPVDEMGTWLRTEKTARNNELFQEIQKLENGRHEP